MTFVGIQVRTLIVYGSEDKPMGFEGRDHMKDIAGSKIAEIPGAGHACYLNKPNDFHNVLHKFLSEL